MTHFAIGIPALRVQRHGRALHREVAVLAVRRLWNEKWLAGTAGAVFRIGHAQWGAVLRADTIHQVRPLVAAIAFSVDAEGAVGVLAQAGLRYGATLHFICSTHAGNIHRLVARLALQAVTSGRVGRAVRQ